MFEAAEATGATTIAQYKLSVEWDEDFRVQKINDF